MAKRLKALIVGSGFAGLCMAIKLKQAGCRDFLLLEKAKGLGGTWRENTYPGAECDVPSALYSYSFEHNSAWEYKWSGQAQILKYLHDTAAKHELDEFICYQQEVRSAVFNSEVGRWLVSTANGEVYDTQHFITAVGQLHKPFTPKFVDVDLYKGAHFHSACWDHSINLDGKRVAVIGNAASAVQFVPEVAKLVAKLTVFQRSPNWVLPKVDRAYRDWEQKLSAQYPWVTKVYRWGIWLTGEYGLLSAIRGRRFAAWAVRRACTKNLHHAIDDAALRAKLTPNYPVGAKRILFSDHYFPALRLAHVNLDTSGIDAFSENGLKNTAGIEYEFDVVIYATGFATNPFLADIDVQGLDGRNIRDTWSMGAQAYLGMTVHGFPNMFMLYGPNTNLGHTSIIIMLEAQANYIVSAIMGLDQKGLSVCQVKQEIEETYNHQLQCRLSNSAFSQVRQSWYMHNGKITNNWAGGTSEYARRLKQVNWQNYELS